MNAIKETTIHIAPPNIQMGEVWIKGTAPLVMHKFSHKAKMQIKAKQEAGSTATKNNKKDAKNFEACFNESRHISMDGCGGARHCMARRGAAGMARRGKMATGIDPWQPGKTGYILITPKGTKWRARNEK